jgi:hypothetical protein
MWENYVLNNLSPVYNLNCFSQLSPGAQLHVWHMEGTMYISFELIKG